jgi:putative ABC transport system ATP-binding protein
VTVRLRARGLAKSYRGGAGERIGVLEAVSLDVAAGEFVAIAGPSGSGKSTLLNLLGLLETPDAGEVWVGEVRASHLGRNGQARIRGRSIGYVFQSFLLVSRLTALENVLLGARYVGRDRAAARRDALALMERLGVLDRRDHYPPQLSGGEQQRVAYCRAALNRPAVVLADEPTGSLDEPNGRTILGELRALARDGGAAIVMVTHHPEAVAEADRVLHLREGRLAGPAVRQEPAPAGGGTTA